MTEKQKREAKRIAGEIIVDGINASLDASESPVRGGRFKPNKADDSPSRLFEEGDLRANITFEEGSGDFITVGVFSSAGDTETAKAYNHNVGDTLPQRRFIPSPNQVFNKEIMERVEQELGLIRQENKRIRSLSDTIDPIEFARGSELVLQLVTDILEGN